MNLPASFRGQLKLPRVEAATWAAGLGLAAIVCCVFREAVFGGRILYAVDINMVWWPQVESFVRSIAAGSWPVWDPTRGFGQPLLADPSAQVLYPPTWLNLLMPSWTYYTLFVVMHLVWSGLGMRLFARRLGVGRLGAFLASAIWVASGPFLSLAQFYHHFAGAAWLPWVFVAGHRMLETPRLRRAVVLALAMAAQILAGSADMTALTLLGIGLYGLAFHVDWRRPFSPANRRLLALGAFAFVLAVGLSAPLWLPTLDLARRSARFRLPADDRTTWSVHPAALVELLLPFSLNALRPLSALVANVIYPKGYWLPSLYLGGPAALLALWTPSPDSVRLRRFLIGLGGAAVLFALGSHTVFYRLTILLVPPLRIFRYPVKAMVLAAFAWSLLAGVGFDTWQARPPGRVGWGRLVLWAFLLLCGTAALIGAVGPRAWWFLPELGQNNEQILGPIAGGLTRAAALSGLALGLALVRGARPSRWMTLGMTALVLGDLVGTHASIHPAAPRELATTRPAVLDTLGRLSEVRLFVYDYSLATRNQLRRGYDFTKWYDLARSPVGFTDHEGLVFGVHMYLNPPTAGRWGVQGSYDLDLLGLFPTPLAELTELLREVESSPLHLRLLQMGGVTHVLALHPAPWWRDLVLVATVPGSFVEPIQVFSVPDTLPRTYAVGSARPVDDSQALGMLTAPDFDPRREILLSSGAASRVTPGFSGSSRVLESRPDRVRLEAQLEQPGYVVLLDAYDEGWKATVDGRPAQVLRANLAFRAVAVSSGRHTIELGYRPAALTVGLFVSALSLAIACASVARDRRAVEEAQDAPQQRGPA